MSFLFALFMGLFTYYISGEIINTLKPVVLACIVAIVATLILSIPSTLLARK